MILTAQCIIIKTASTNKNKNNVAKYSTKIRANEDTMRKECSIKKSRVEINNICHNQ